MSYAYKREGKIVNRIGPLVLGLLITVVLGGCDRIVGVNKALITEQETTSTSYYSSVSAAADGGVIHYWRLDEPSGATSDDAIGTSDGANTGTNIQTGKYGNCREFPTDNANSIFIGNPAHTSYVDYTISMWINFASCTTYTRYLLYCTEIRIFTNSSGLLYVWDGANKSLGYDIDTGGFDTNTWVYLTLVIDGTASTVDLYINGSHAGTQITNWAAGRNITGNTYFGYTGNYNFRGFIDDIAVWNRALSASQVSDVYAVTQSAPLVD